jgi:hypothetical protein
MPRSVRYAVSRSWCGRRAEMLAAGRCSGSRSRTARKRVLEAAPEQVADAFAGRPDISTGAASGGPVPVDHLCGPWSARLQAAPGCVAWLCAWLPAGSATTNPTRAASTAT